MRKCITYLFIFMFLLGNISICVSATETTKKSADVKNASISEESLKNNENAQKLWDYCIKDGQSEWWAAAVIGNAVAEHGLQTDLNSSNGYWGAFQFKDASKNSFKVWCRTHNLSETDITAQYEYLGTTYRGSSVKACTGLDFNTLKKDTTYVKDAYSAAAYFASGLEGCTCWSGVTTGKGYNWHPNSHNDLCGEFDFGPSGCSFGKISLQHLKRRAANTEVAYKIFSGKTPTSSGGSNSTNTNIKGNIVSEQDLVGMPNQSKLTKNQEKINLPDREGLTLGEVYSIDMVGEDVRLYNQAISMNRARVLISFIGLCLIIYSVLMFVAMIFDRSNTFIEMSLVSALTLGKLKYSPYEKDERVNKKGSSNTSKLLISTTVILVVGMLIISGAIWNGMSNIVFEFSQKFM